MLIEANSDEARAMLRAMCNVGTAGEKVTLTDITHRTIVSACRLVFDQEETLVQHTPRINPRHLAAALRNERQAVWAVRFLAVTALADGVLDNRK
jgi:hypothetical protein